MGLSNDLISQFVKVTKDTGETKSETTVYGTIVEYDDKKYVKLDGSELLTPVTTTADTEDGERVTVMIKNHTATVTGNISSPSARTDTVTEIGNQITEVEILIADKVDTLEFAAEVARIDELKADTVTIKESLTAAEADIDELEADNVTITETLTAHTADIENLDTYKLSATDAELTYATITDLEATNADIHNLEADYGDFKVLATDSLDAVKADIETLNTVKLNAADAEIIYATISNLDATNADIDILEADYADFKVANAETLVAVDASIKDLEANKLSASDAELLYANIDFSNIGQAAIEEFFSKSGMIEDLIVGDGTITGQLVGVTIKGDLIEGNTVVADKLVIKGEDGLYYKLNTDGVTTESEQTEYNSLDGSVITAKSITATKISVDDLVAFDATIGGFNITDDSIYSGVKESVDNTTRGIYLDNDGQIAFGDGSNYVKFYKDSDGEYKLEISANAIFFGSSNRSVETAIDDMEIRIDNAETSITQNTEQIALAATKLEVTETLDGYYTKEEADAAIQVSSNSITTTVSSTYATKTELETVKDEVTTNLRIESSRGTVFKNNTISSVLSAVIYRGSARITDIDALHEAMGSSAYLQWSWQRLDEDTFGTILSTDSRIGNNGFTFTLSPEDVDTKVTFLCELVV